MTILFGWQDLGFCVAATDLLIGNAYGHEWYMGEKLGRCLGVSDQYLALAFPGINTFNEIITLSHMVPLEFLLKHPPTDYAGLEGLKSAFLMVVDVPKAQLYFGDQGTCVWPLPVHHVYCLGREHDSLGWSKYQLFIRDRVQEFFNVQGEYSPEDICEIFERALLDISVLEKGAVDGVATYVITPGQVSTYRIVGQLGPVVRPFAAALNEGGESGLAMEDIPEIMP